MMLDATPASDIWSTACTAIELSTGKPPYFDLSTAQACFRMVEDEHPPLPPNMSPGMAEFMVRAFVKDYTKRATAKELLALDWFKPSGAPALSAELHSDGGNNNNAAPTLVVEHPPPVDAKVARRSVSGVGGGGGTEAAGAPMSPPLAPPPPPALAPSKRSGKRSCYRCDARLGAFSSRTCKSCRSVCCKKCCPKDACLDCQVLAKSPPPV
jgi:serine/threonine protein kinase